MSRHCRPRRELSKAERTNYYKALLVWGCFTLGGWLSIPSEYLPLFSHCIGFGFFLVLITGKTRWLIALSVGALIFSMLIYHTIPRSSIVLLSHSIGYIGMIALMIVVVFCTAVRPKLNNNDSNNNNNSSSNNNNSNVSNNNNDNNNKELDNDNNNDNDKSALFDRLNDRAFITQQFFDDIAKSMQILQLSMIDTYHEMQTYLHSLAVNNQSTSPIPSSPLPPLTPPPPLLSPSINDDDIEEEIEEEEEKEENQSPHHHQHHNNNKSSKKAEKKKRAKAKKKKK